MKIFYIIGLALIFFVSIILLYKKHNKDVLSSIAIGCVIASNIFNPSTYGFSIGDFVFGIDCVTYTVFIYCIIMMYFDYGKKSAISLTHSSIVAIFIAGLIQMFAQFSVIGWDLIVVWNFSSFLFSILASYAAIYLMLFIVEKCKIKSQYVALSVMLIVASLINSFIYFGLVAMINSQILSNNFINVLIGSYIGKCITFVLGIISFIFIKNKIITNAEK